MDIEEKGVNPRPCGECTHFYETSKGHEICELHLCSTSKHGRALYLLKNGPCFSGVSHSVQLDTNQSEQFDDFMTNFEYYSRLADESMNRYLDGDIDVSSNEANLARGMNAVIVAINEKLKLLEGD